MKPRAWSARERVRGKPVNAGCRNAQAMAAGSRHLSDPRLERAPPLLDHLAREPLEAVDAFLQDHALDRLADHVATREPGALVEQVVHRRPGALLAAEQVPLGELVVLAHLHARQVRSEEHTSELQSQSNLV